MLQLHDELQSRGRHPRSSQRRPCERLRPRQTRLQGDVHRGRRRHRESALAALRARPWRGGGARGEGRQRHVLLGGRELPDRPHAGRGAQAHHGGGHQRVAPPRPARTLRVRTLRASLHRPRGAGEEVRPPGGRDRMRGAPRRGARDRAQADDAPGEQGRRAAARPEEGEAHRRDRPQRRQAGEPDRGLLRPAEAGPDDYAAPRLREAREGAWVRG